MGFFKSVKKIATRTVAAVATGGTTELLRATGNKSLAKSIEGVLAPTNIKSIAGVALAAGTGNPSFLALSSPAGPSTSQSTNPYYGQQSYYGGDPMALNIGGLLGTVGGILGGNQNPYFQTASNLFTLASSAVATPTQNFPTYPQPQPMMQPTMVSSGAVAVRSQALTKEVFNAGLQLLSKLGLPAPANMSGFTRVLKGALSSIASLARRTPSGTMVSLLAGLGLAVYESNLLTVWFAQKKRGRRMNPANSKALRRAARRIKSFHRLCTHTDLLKTRSRSAGRARCGTCRKSPCRC